MGSLTPSSNSHSSAQEVLLHNYSVPMKKFQDLVFKLAQASPNAPLAPPAETLTRDFLHRFVSRYTTPDHPPYSAMIQTALEELNEKWGSSEESISEYLEKKYDDLPLAHSALLKHHLEKTCESGEIVLTRAGKYRLAGSLKLRTGSKSKPRRRKWRWECERQKFNRHKSIMRKKNNQRRGNKFEGMKKDQECAEEEKCSTENGEYGDGKQDQSKSLLSCVDPTSLIIEPLGVVAAANGKKSPEEASSQLENDPCSKAKADIWATHAQEHQGKEQSEHDQPKLSTPERPPGFELVTVENLHQLGLTKPGPAFAGEMIWSMQTLGLTESVTPLKAGNHDPLQSEDTETCPSKQRKLDAVQINLKEMHHGKQKPQLTKADAEEVVQSVLKDTKLIRYGIRGWSRKAKNLTHSEPEAEADVENLEVVDDC